MRARPPRRSSTSTTAGITAVYEDDGDGTFEPTSDDSQLVACEYDGFNRRIVKTDKTGQSDVDYDYYYNENWQVLEVRKDGDSDPYKQYIWDPRYIDAPVVRFRDGNTDGDLGDSEDDTLYYLTDANFNITALADTDGDIVERYEYDAYGKVTVLHGDDDADGGEVTEWDVDSGGSDWDNQILYCGYRFDGQTQTYHVRHRQYHPTLGRWLQRDPAGYADGMSLYEYCASVPVAKLDSTGLESAGLDGGVAVGIGVSVSIKGGFSDTFEDCCVDGKKSTRWTGKVHVTARVGLGLGIKIKNLVDLMLEGPGIEETLSGSCVGPCGGGKPCCKVCRSLGASLTTTFSGGALGFSVSYAVDGGVTGTLCYYFGNCQKTGLMGELCVNLVDVVISYDTPWSPPKSATMFEGWRWCKKFNGGIPKEEENVVEATDGCEPPEEQEFAKFCTCPLGPGKCPCLGVGRDDCQK